MKQEDRGGVTGSGHATIRAAGSAGWFARWWQFVSAAAHQEISTWQATLLSRRKFTHPSEVKKMREPVKPATRATWYR